MSCPVRLPIGGCRKYARFHLAESLCLDLSAPGLPRPDSPIACSRGAPPALYARRRRLMFRRADWPGSDLSLGLGTFRDEEQFLHGLLQSARDEDSSVDARVGAMILFDVPEGSCGDSGKPGEFSLGEPGLLAEPLDAAATGLMKFHTDNDYVGVFHGFNYTLLPHHASSGK